MNYYNEFDKKTAEWLKELIKAKLIPPGDVDTRSIVDVTGSDLIGYSQHHFFAGIGGWSLALQLAGWLDDLQTDLEREGYAVGHCVLGAHSVNAAHIRQRLYWVANSEGEGRRRREEVGGWGYKEFRGSSENSRMANTKTSAREWSKQRENSESYSRIINGLVNCLDGKQRPIESSIHPLAHGLPRGMVYSGDPCESINETQEARVMRLKGYGNAIVPQVAAQFVCAFMDYCQND